MGLRYHSLLRETIYFLYHSRKLVVYIFKYLYYKFSYNSKYLITYNHQNNKKNVLFYLKSDSWWVLVLMPAKGDSPINFTVAIFWKTACIDVRLNSDERQIWDSQSVYSYCLSVVLEVLALVNRNNDLQHWWLMKSYPYIIFNPYKSLLAS